MSTTVTLAGIRRIASAGAVACAVALGTGACASAPRTPSELPVTVEVANAYTGARQQEISILVEGGDRTVLGSVEPGQTRTFEARDLDTSRLYRLGADAPTGALVRSQPFDLAPGARVSWDLSINRVQVDDEAP